MRTLKPGLNVLKPRVASVPNRSSADAHPFSTRRGAKIRDSIVIRDACTCQLCGVIVRGGRSSGRSAVVDHTRPWRLRPDLKFEEENLKTLCRDCHAVFRAIEDRLWPNAEAIAAEKLRRIAA